MLTLEEMPDLADRVRDFQTWLGTEPCTHPGNKGLPPTIDGCLIISNSRRMCPACRIRLKFHHLIYNAEAYYDDERKDRLALLRSSQSVPAHVLDVVLGYLSPGEISLLSQRNPQIAPYLAHRLEQA
jgi:hypothetical protein